MLAGGLFSSCLLSLLLSPSSLYSCTSSLIQSHPTHPRSYIFILEPNSLCLWPYTPHNWPIHPKIALFRCDTHCRWRHLLASYTYSDSRHRQTAHVNMKTKISLRCPSLLVFYFLKIYYIEKKVKWEALMVTRWLYVLQAVVGRVGIPACAETQIHVTLLTQNRTQVCCLN